MRPLRMTTHSHHTEKSVAGPTPELRQLTLLVLAIVILSCLWVGARSELLPEETYYWMYSQHRALSYFDHPPMIAWLIEWGTWLFGNNELGVRSGTILLTLGNCWLMYALGARWFNARIGWWSVLLFLTLPVYVGTGLFTLPDGPLIFFWLLTLYAITKAVQADSDNGGHTTTLYWLLAGAAFGGALLSKYYAVLLAPSLLLFLVLSPQHRFWLRRPQPWLALLIAMVLFSPVIIWNAEYDWASFLFQSTRTVVQKINPLAGDADFWLFQLSSLTPLGLVLMALATVHGVRRGWQSREDSWNFAVAFSVPLFCVFLLASFKIKVHVDWTAPAFLSLCPAGAAVFLEKLEAHPRRWRWGGITQGFISATILMLAMTSLTFGVPAYHHAGGWRSLAGQVTGAADHLAAVTHRQPFVVGVDKYYLASELGFYMHRPNDAINRYALGETGLGYRYWTDLGKLEGRPAIAVLPRITSANMAPLAAHFTTLDPAVRVQVHSLGKGLRTVWLVNCYGYHRI